MSVIQSLPNQSPSEVNRLNRKNYLMVLKSWLVGLLTALWRSGSMMILRVLVGVPATLSYRPNPQNIFVHICKEFQSLLTQSI